MSQQQETFGIQELIDQLSQDGVEEGRSQAQQIVSEAQRQADEIIDSARKQADEILNQARQEAERMRTSGQEALRLAARDTIRDFSARIHNDFRNRLQELVGHELRNPELIRDMILEVTRQATQGVDTSQVEIVLSRELPKTEQEGDKPFPIESDALTEFIQGLIGQDLREGFRVDLGSQTHEGLTLRVADGKIEVDLTTEAIAEFLYQHLMPRYRAIMHEA